MMERPIAQPQPDAAAQKKKENVIAVKRMLVAAEREHWHGAARLAYLVEQSKENVSLEIIAQMELHAETPKSAVKIEVYTTAATMTWFAAQAGAALETEDVEPVIENADGDPQTKSWETK